jgi:hypothetical protein
MRTLMQNLSPRHVEKKESARLGVQAGWYGTKVSGTFVTGPHATEADCRRKIAELDAPTTKGSPESNTARSFAQEGTELAS